MTRPFVLALAVLATACQSPRQEEVPGRLVGSPGGEGCAAGDYQGLVGSMLSAVTYPADLRVRIIEPGMMVTMEYIPERMTIHVDGSGTITRVVCG